MQFALITARGGSSRLPHKNRLDLAGRPLFRWTLDAALASGVFHRVWVSSDDPEILSISRGLAGVLVDERPAELASSAVSSLKVLEYMIPKARAEAPGLERFCLLQPTSPFLGPANMARAMALLDGPDVDFVVGVSRFDAPPHFAVSIAGGVQPVQEGALTRVTRSQDVPVLHHPAGGIYAGRIDAFARSGHFYGPRTRPLLLDPVAAWDINLAEDLEAARLLARGMEA